MTLIHFLKYKWVFMQYVLKEKPVVLSKAVEYCWIQSKYSLLPSTADASVYKFSGGKIQISASITFQSCPTVSIARFLPENHRKPNLRYVGYIKLNCVILWTWEKEEKGRKYLFLFFYEASLWKYAEMPKNGKCIWCLGLRMYLKGK